MNAEEVERALKPLIGKSWSSIGRSVDLVWLQFGQMRQVPSIDGGKKWVGEWALHLQCPWRVVRNERDFLASKDMWLDADGKPMARMPDDPFGTLFDDTVWWLRQNLPRNAPWIKSVATFETSGFVLLLSDLSKIEVTTHGKGEQWRLFRPATEHPHFVAEC